MNFQSKLQMSPLSFLKRLSETVVVIITALMIHTEATANPQAAATQTFTVYVPQAVSIVQPSNAWMQHDLTSNNQVFPVQWWTVTGNTQNGVLVTFTASSPFTNTANPAYLRDAALSLQMGPTTGAATWSVVTATAQTNYANNVQTATVSANSSGVGRANILLTVTFLTGDVTLLHTGNYTTTITGTVTAN